MFGAGGEPSSAERREVVLYRLAGEADDFNGRTKEPVRVAQDVCDTLFGTSEFSLRAIHVYWSRPMRWAS